MSDAGEVRAEALARSLEGFLVLKEAGALLLRSVPLERVMALGVPEHLAKVHSRRHLREDEPA